MGILQDLNIVKGSNTLAAGIFEDLHPSFMELEYETPSGYISTYWDSYVAIRENRLDNDQQQRGVNGKIFEYIIATLLVREKIFPVYMELFGNQKFNQNIKDLCMKYVKSLLKKYVDKRGKDYQDIKKFVSTNFKDLGFLTDKQIVELFKTRRKKKVPAKS